ncbi:hypothetical protein [Streptomyces tubercidicus]
MDRIDVLREAIEAVRDERLSDDTGTPDDEAYNRAIDAAIHAIESLDS